MKSLIRKGNLLILLFVGVYGTGFSQEKTSTNFTSNIGGYTRFDIQVFPKNALYSNQHSSNISAYYQPEVELEWGKKKRHSLSFKGFLRISQYDNQSTHADIRTLYYNYYIKDWEFSFGVKKVFWGFAESNHLVDIINQYDGLEGFDIEQKLGQPMAHISKSFKWGTLDLLGLTYHRPLVFPGEEGRPRPQGVLNYKKPDYEGKHGRYRPEVALRWSNSVYINNVSLDFGLSHFYGHSRVPFFKLDQNYNPTIQYELINQSGLELQLASGASLLKFEGIRRESKRETTFGYVIGEEYTISNVKNSGVDLGLIAEYTYDQRGGEVINGFDNDLFIGARVTANDINSTELIAGYTFDLNDNTQTYLVKFNRRIGDNWKLNLTALGYTKVSSKQFLYQLRRDDFLRFSMYYYF